MHLISNTTCMRFWPEQTHPQPLPPHPISFSQSASHLANSQPLNSQSLFHSLSLPPRKNNLQLGINPHRDLILYPVAFHRRSRCVVNFSTIPTRHFTAVPFKPVQPCACVTRSRMDRRTFFSCCTRRISPK